jgi:hypothetical protein
MIDGERWLHHDLLLFHLLKVAMMLHFHLLWEVVFVSQIHHLHCHEDLPLGFHQAQESHADREIYNNEKGRWENGEY